MSQSVVPRLAEAAPSPGRTALMQPPAEWGVGEDVPVGVFADVAPADLLSELEMHERLTAWLVARGVAIIEQLTRAREAEALERLDVDHPGASSRRRTLARTEARACIEDEVALATGISIGVARARTALAIDDEKRSAPVRRALGRGQMSWQRAWHVTGLTQEVPAEAIDGIVDKLVAPYPARSVHGVGGLLVPQQIFTARLSYQLAKVLTQSEQHESNLRGRNVTTVVDAEFGTGQLTVSGHAARITGAHERVDGIARTLRSTGDQRTLNQLRSDITLDLICYGQITAPEPSLLDPTAGAPSSSTRTAGVRTAGVRMAASEAEAPPADGPTFDVTQFGGALPPARVDVVVPMSVLLSASDEPGMVTCGDEQQWLAAAFIRDIAFAAGSTWRRLVTDPVTGHMRDLTVTGYEITGELRERIFARDRITRAPGRTRPARWCDTDHDIDHALGGPSSESNVSAKDRRGHNHKTRHTWTSSRAPGIDGEILWTTPTGRQYATLPWSYHDPGPPHLDDLRATFARNTMQADAVGADALGPDSLRFRTVERDSVIAETVASDVLGSNTTGTATTSSGAASRGTTDSMSRATASPATTVPGEPGAGPTAHDEAHRDAAHDGSGPRAGDGPEPGQVDQSEIRPTDVPGGWAAESFVVEIDPDTIAGGLADRHRRMPSPARRPRTDGLAGRHSRYEHHLALLIHDHHTAGVLTRTPKARPPKKRGSDTHRSGGQAPRTPWGHGEAGPPPF